MATKSGPPPSPGVARGADSSGVRRFIAAFALGWFSIRRTWLQRKEQLADRGRRLCRRRGVIVRMVGDGVASYNPKDASINPMPIVTRSRKAAINRRTPKPLANAALDAAPLLVVGVQV